MSNKHDDLIQTVKGGKLPSIPKTTSNKGVREVTRISKEGLVATTFTLKKPTVEKEKNN